MSTALIWLGVSIFFLGGITILFRIEDSYGDQLFLARARRAGDRLVVRVKNQLGGHQVTGLDYVRLTWHYIIHIFLRRIIRGIVWVQHKLEDSLQRNKEAAKIIRADSEPSHLTEIAQHKHATALSDEERERRKAH